MSCIIGEERSRCHGIGPGRSPVRLGIPPLAAGAPFGQNLPVERKTVADLASVGTGAVVVAAVMVAGAVGLSADRSAASGTVIEPALQPAFQLVLAVGWAVPAIVMAVRRNALPFWIPAQIAAVSHSAAAVLVAAAPDNQWSVWVASWIIVVDLPALTAIVQVFPTGRPLAGWRPYLVLSVAVGVVGVVAVAIEALPGVGTSWGDAAGLVAIPLLAFTAIGGVVPLAIRFRRTVASERRAIMWLLIAVGAGVVVPAMVASGGQSGEVAAQLFILVPLVFISVAVLRYRVWGLTPMMQRSMQQVVRATDVERRRIRAELHDGVGAGLTAVRLTVDAARQLVDRRPVRAAEMLDSASSDIGTVLDDVRRLIEGLRPAVLDRMDLGAALRQRAEELSSHSPGLSVTVVDEELLAQLSPGVEVSVYRLVTEAMSNVVRHADATHCEVLVSARRDGIVIEVSDNGNGSTEHRSDGLGLSSMAARATEVGGYMVAGERPHRGFRVQAVIPRAVT